MKRVASILIAAAALAVFACPAAAELCGRCKGKVYIRNIGKCVTCGGMTRSGAFKLCKKCSARLGECEHCRKPLGKAAKDAQDRWSKERANAWYARQPWLIGCNFIPSTAVNQLEMWQEQTFDLETIDRELGLAAGIGFNTVRVYLHDLAWRADAAGFKKRIGKYLETADRHGIRTMFVVFDDCWNDNPKIGPQPAPIPGVHNSGWLQSPGRKTVLDRRAWQKLEPYVLDVIGSFRDDRRILMWDMYNEPGNRKLGDRSLPLLTAAFKWARAAKPTQPLTVGIYGGSAKLKPLRDFQLAASDVITFHNYGSARSLTSQIRKLKALGRPVICTEYLSRGRGSRFQTHLPIFKRERVGCYNWGLVSGKTQTIYPWGSKKGAPEPKMWHHDIFRKDGTPFDTAEIELIRKLTQRPRPEAAAAEAEAVEDR